MPLVVYYSSVSENTRRFVDKLALDNLRIPLRASEGPLEVQIIQRQLVHEAPRILRHAGIIDDQRHGYSLSLAARRLAA